MYNERSCLAKYISQTRGEFVGEVNSHQVTHQARLN